MKQLFAEFDSGSALAASRLMSIVERGGSDAETVLDTIFPKVGGAYRIGLTGGTGSGKSTLINTLMHALRDRGNTLGVVAEDPSSPFTGGAVLGDRIRMSRAMGDSGVFVRSVASRGSEVGFSTVATELADVLDAFGRDTILLETIGVGQLEYRIRFAADTTVVVFTPEGGDEVQSLKSGLMEVGDIFVVNKADRPDAESFADEVRSTLTLRYDGHPWVPPVVLTVANQEKGTAELLGAIDDHRSHLEASGQLQARRQDGSRSRVRALAEAKLAGIFWRNPYINKEFDGILKKVFAGRLSPYRAAERLVEAFHEGDR